MPYEAYAPRPCDLTSDENREITELMQDRGQDPIDQGFVIQHNRVVMNDPVLNAYARFAYRRADNELQDIDMPMIPNLHADYPNVDPKGKHCRTDMDFAQRAIRLESAANACDPTIKKAVDNFLSLRNIPSTTLYSFAMRVDDACKEIQHADYASKVCISPHVRNLLAQQANNIALNDPDIQKMDRIFTALEQVTGLRGGSLDPQAIAEHNALNLFAQLDATLPTGVHVKRTSPKTLAVNFQNFESIVMQDRYTNPGHGQNDRNSLDRHMSRYAGATATSALDGLFAPLEQFSNTSYLDAHRATLTIVDGKTVSEHMQEIYKNLNTETPFNNWYAANLKELSGRIVAAGLMAGKRVEAYVPGPDGKLPDQPTVLHRAGYEPTPEKPVTLNAWERFFSRFGFYKEKFEQVKNQKALLDARERMKTTYTVAQNERLSNSGSLVKDMFFGDFLRRNNIPNMAALRRNVLGNHIPLSGKADRGSYTGACIGLMAAQGHDIRDILDPTKLVQEKKDVGEMFMEKLLTNRTLVRLTDPNANLSQQERQQLAAQLMADTENYLENDVATQIEQIRARKPKMPKALAGLTSEQIIQLEENAIAHGQLNDEQTQELEQLKAQQANADQNPLTQEQNRRLLGLTQQQQQWQLHQQMEQWRHTNRELFQEERDVVNGAAQKLNDFNALLAEAQNDPNFKLNLTDPRIPQCLQEGNGEWIGSVLFHGQQALNNQITAIIKQTDMNDLAQRQKVMPVLGCAAQCMYDIMQDISDDRVMLGFYKAASQTVMHEARPDKITGELRVGNDSVLEAAEKLASKYLKAGNDIGNVVDVLRNGDHGRAALIQPYLDTRKFTTNLSHLLIEKEVMQRIEPNRNIPFADRVPEGALVSNLKFSISGATDGTKGIGALADTRRPDAKTVLSGALANSFDVKPDPTPIDTVYDRGQKLSMHNDGTYFVARGDTPQTIFVGDATVTLRPEAAKKLGLPVQNSRTSLLGIKM